MIAFAVYIISIDGRLLVSSKFQSAQSIPNETLITALFTAIQGVAGELSPDNSELRTMEIKNLAFHFKSFGYYRIVLVTDVSNKPKNIIHILGLRFMKDHGDILIENPQAPVNEFESFSEVIKEIIQEDLTIDVSQKISPSKKFNSLDLVNLSEDITPTALAMIALKEGTIDEISNESGIGKNETIFNLNQLQEYGLIGIKKINSDLIYFCSF